MKVNPQPPEKVRMVTTHEGKFLHFEDMVDRLKEDSSVDHILVLLKVGHDRRDDRREVIRRAVCSFLACCGAELIKSSSSYKDETSTDSPGLGDPGGQRGPA